MYNTQHLRMYVRVLSINALGASVVRGESVLRTHAPASRSAAHVMYTYFVRYV
jgi:hypothetical protein